MPGWIEKFLIALFVALGERLFAKGEAYAKSWKSLRDELSQNEKKANEYQGVVDNPESTREDRRRAEDDLLS